jgi:hypothetical protein
LACVWVQEWPSIAGRGDQDNEAEEVKEEEKKEDELPSRIINYYKSLLITPIQQEEKNIPDLVRNGSGWWFQPL